MKNGSSGYTAWSTANRCLLQNKVYRKVVKAKGGKNQSNGKMATTRGLFARDWILLDLMDALSKARPEVTPMPTFLLPHFQTPGKCLTKLVGCVVCVCVWVCFVW